MYCENADDMFYPVLAERVRFLKTNEHGVSKMCETMERLIAEFGEGFREEGRFNEKKETALSMLYDHMSIRMIAKYTKLSLDAIRELAAKNNLPITE